MEYKIGNFVRINIEPKFWTSLFNVNHPKNGNIVYPFEGEITQLQYNFDNIKDYHPAEIGGYGFDLYDLIKNNNIELIKRTIKTDTKYLIKLFKKLKIK